MTLIYNNEVTDKDWLLALENVKIREIFSYFSGLENVSLLSSAPLSQHQIDLGQQIARKHGFTE